MLPVSGGVTETAWTTDLRSRIAAKSQAVQDDIPESQITAMDAWYTAEIAAGRLPATPAGGTGNWDQLLPLFGTSSIEAATIAAIGTNATNVDGVDGDRDVVGRIVTDNSLFFNSNTALNSTEYSVVLSVSNPETTLGVWFGAKAAAGTIGNSRHALYVRSAGQLRGEGFTSLFTNVAQASVTSGMYVHTSKDDAVNPTSDIYLNKVNVSSQSGGTQKLPSDTSIYWFGENRSNDGTVSSPSSSTFQLVAMLNKELTFAEVESVTDNLNALLTAFGR
ncbi:MAG: hypothetical protein AAFX78_04955 [Cyanobacteria bacterium J06638_20]